MPVGLLAAALAAQSAGAIGRRCNDLVRAAEAQGLAVGLCARDLDSKTLLASHRADEAFVPASNQKILTVAAVLAELGTEYRFRTGFALRQGTLVVRAGGDPNWITGSEQDPHQLFAGVVNELSRAGVAAVRGIEIDAGAFRGPGRPEGWPSDQFERDYCAPSAGLLLDGACWGIAIDPSHEGQPARVALVAPWTGYALDGDLTCTRDQRKGGRYRVVEADASLRLSGNFWTRSQTRIVHGACADPSAVFVRALEAALREVGITVDPAARARDLDLKDVTTPLLPAVERALRDSSNIDAEQMFRVLGAERGGDGSYSGAPAALRAALARMVGDLPEGIDIVDGSGLSRLDHATPHLLVDVLGAVARSPHAKLFAGALPIAGEDGTLRRRFKGSGLEGRVRAKTGTLANVSALSGYLATVDRRIILFSILVDSSRIKKGAMPPRQLQEELVAALDGEGL